jgi:DNA helicase HerA-like ATPase
MDISFEDVLKQFMGYKEDKESNVTIIDLSGVPFEVLSITVSLISRILFDFSYYYKKINNITNIPLLLVFEEAHKYVPKSDLAKYKSSRFSIERIAKEGRKYGITIAIVSQRPSEVSETIFSQCNTFIAMRLTNPDDQNYVKKLLPDTLGSLTSMLNTLPAGDALLIGESVIMPSVVSIDRCNPEPSSNDIMYIDEWKKEWYEANFKEIIEKWNK